MMKSRIALGFGAAVVAVSTISTPAAIPDPVKTANGLVSGVTLKSGVRVFKGIPFAAPPVGELRWKLPQPAATWEGVRKADTFSNVCVSSNARRRSSSLGRTSTSVRSG